MCTLSVINRIWLRLSAFLLVVLSSLFLSFTTPAGSYHYLNPTSVQDLVPYTTALSKADLDRYRYIDERNVLVFDTGLQVELLSANEMKALNMPVRIERVRTEKPAFNTGSVFKLTAEGGIAEVMTKTKVK